MLNRKWIKVHAALRESGPGVPGLITQHAFTHYARITCDAHAVRVYRPAGRGVVTALRNPRVSTLATVPEKVLGERS